MEKEKRNDRRELVGWFWVKQPFETVFQSISGRLPKRGRERKERIEESKNVQTTPTRTYCKCSRPLPYCNLNCRTPRHWKFTQHHRTTRPPTVDESKNVQTTPTRTHCKRSRSLLYCTMQSGLLAHLRTNPLLVK